MSVPHFSEEYTLDKIIPEMKQEMINKIDNIWFCKMMMSLFFLTLFSIDS